MRFAPNPNRAPLPTIPGIAISTAERLAVPTASANDAPCLVVISFVRAIFCFLPPRRGVPRNFAMAPTISSLSNMFLNIGAKFLYWLLAIQSGRPTNFPAASNHRSCRINRPAGPVPGIRIRNPGSNPRCFATFLPASVFNSDRDAELKERPFDAAFAAVNAASCNGLAAAAVPDLISPASSMSSALMRANRPSV